MLKVVNRMVLNRIQPILDLLLQSNQNGFRPGRSTTAQILTLRRIIEAARNLPAVIKFIDFRKAFDSINRRKMLQILKAYGVPAQLVDAIGKTYWETWANVLSLDSENSSNNHRHATRRHTGPLLGHNTSRLCTTRGYQGSWGESWTNHQA